MRADDDVLVIKAIHEASLSFPVFDNEFSTVDISYIVYCSVQTLMPWPTMDESF